jgi:hypothetical protein
MEVEGKAANVEIVAVSGTLQITIRPRLRWWILALEFALLAVFVYQTKTTWPKMELISKVLFVWVEVAAVVGILYEISGSEVIEFTSDRLIIRKEVLGYPRTSEHPLDKCSDLQVNGQNRGQKGLQRKIGWRTTHFGKYLSEEQAIQIIVELQRSLPEVSAKIGADSSSSAKKFTWLKLD